MPKKKPKKPKPYKPKKSDRPRNLILQVVKTNGEVSNQRLCARPEAIVVKANAIASQPDTEQVLILDGNADPDNPNPHLVISCITKAKDEAGSGWIPMQESLRWRTFTPTGEKTRDRIYTSPTTYGAKGNWYNYRDKARKWEAERNETPNPA